MIPRSGVLIWLNLSIALIVGAGGFGLGFYEGIAAQLVILYTVVSVAVLFWAANYVTVIFEQRGERAADAEHTAPAGGSVWASNRVLIVAMAVLLLAYLIVTATVPGFRTVANLITFLLLEAILVFAFKVSRVFAQGRSAFIGLIVLGALIVVSSFTANGLTFRPSPKAGATRTIDRDGAVWGKGD